MKRLSKKVTRITGILILSLGLFISPLFSSRAKASTNTWDYNFVYTANNIRATASGYGCVDPDYYAYNSSQNVRYKHVLTINFPEIVTGQAYITFPFQRGDIVVTENCTVTFNGSSTSGFYVNINNVNFCKIEVYTISDGSYFGDFSHSCSLSTDSDNAYLGTMLSIFQDSTYGFRSMAVDVDVIRSKMDTILQTLGYIDQSIQSLDQTAYNELYNIYSQLYDSDNGVAYLQEIYEALSDLNIPDQSSYFNQMITALLNIQSNTDNVETTLSNIYSKLTSINTSMTTITSNLGSYIHTNLDVPRWQLPAYKWVYDVSYTSGQYSSWSHYTGYGMSFRYTNGTGDDAFTVNKSFSIVPGTSDTPAGRKFIVSWVSASAYAGNYTIYSNYSGTGSLPSNWSIDRFSGSSSNGGYRDGLYYYYVIFSGDYSPSATPLQFEIEFNDRYLISPIYVGYLDVMPDDAYSLLGFKKTDELLNAATSYFSDSLDLLQDIANGIAGLSGTQQDIDNSVTVTNNFDTSMTTVNNVEVDILTDIDAKFSAVNDAINSNISGIPVGPANAKQFYDLYIGHLFAQFPLFKYPIYIVLVGFVLLCLLG